MNSLPQHTNRSHRKSTEKMGDTMQDILHLAKGLGATQASVAINHDQGFSVDVRLGEVETVAFSDDQEVSVTVYLGHRKGSASSTDTSKEAIESIVKAAIDIASVSAEDPCFGLADKELMAKEIPDLDLYHPWDITVPEAIEKATACEKIARSYDHRITNSDGVHLSTYVFQSGYANSHGFLGIVESSRHNMSCALMAQTEDQMQRDYEYTTARKWQNLLSSEQLAEQAAQKTINKLGGRQIKTQKAPILFSSQLACGLFAAFMSAISGGSLYRKSSFLLDSLGQQIFPSFINIHEQPHLLGALGSAAFDGEGVKTRNNVWIKEGILQQYMQSSFTARKMGMQTTGNCGGVFNLTIDPTDKDLNSLLKQMDTGFYVTDLMGQGVNLLTGDYSRGASGFWVEHGKIQFPVEEVTIAGNLKEMFKNILAVGNDLNPNTTTRCGSLLLSEMMIAGSN